MSVSTARSSGRYAALQLILFYASSMPRGRHERLVLRRQTLLQAGLQAKVHSTGQSMPWVDHLPAALAGRKQCTEAPCRAPLLAPAASPAHFAAASPVWSTPVQSSYMNSPICSGPPAPQVMLQSVKCTCTVDLHEPLSSFGSLPSIAVSRVHKTNIPSSHTWAPCMQARLQNQAHLCRQYLLTSIPFSEA